MAIELSVATANDSSLAAGEVLRGKAGSGHAAHGVMSFLAQLGAAAGHAKAVPPHSGQHPHAAVKQTAVSAQHGSGTSSDGKALTTTAGDSALVLAQLQLNLAQHGATPRTSTASAASAAADHRRTASGHATETVAGAPAATDATDPAIDPATNPATASKASGDGTDSSTDESATASSTTSPADASASLSAALAGNGLLPLTGMSLVSGPVAAPASPLATSASPAIAHGASRAVALSTDVAIPERAAVASSSAMTPPLKEEADASEDGASAAAPVALDKRAHSFAATSSTTAGNVGPVATSGSGAGLTAPGAAVTDLDQRLRALSSLSGGEGGSMVKPAASAGAGSGAAHLSGPGWSLSNLASMSGASTASAASASASLPAGASGTVSEQQVAAQVTMWASQNIKSAELKLDAHGKDPVEVSISMTGNQAQVHFRSDVAQTRELLTRSAAALDSSMQREGLVLTGMTVGTSAQGRDNAGASGENASSGGKSVLRAVATVDAASTVSASRTPQGALDLFV